MKVLGCDDRQLKKQLFNYFVNDTCRVSYYKILFSLFKGQGVLKDGITLLENILIKKLMVMNIMELYLQVPPLSILLTLPCLILAQT